MPNPADVDDVIARFRPLTELETINAEAFLDDAWWMLVARRPALEADMDSGAVATENVIRVVAYMVRRVLLNPEGLLQEEIDDYSKRRDSLTSTGSLYVTDEELADITVGGARRVRSVRLAAYGDR